MGPLENGYQELLQLVRGSRVYYHPLSEMAAEKKATLLFITSSPTSLDQRHTRGVSGARWTPSWGEGGGLDATSASVKYPRGVTALQQSRKSNDGGQ